MRARKSIKESQLGDHAGGRRPRRPVGMAPMPPMAPTTPTPTTATTQRVTRWALTQDVEAELAEIAAGAGCELIHAEWKGGVLRLFLDRPAAAMDPAPADPAAPADLAADTPRSDAGVTLADCEHVAKLASAFLDVLTDVDRVT